MQFKNITLSSLEIFLCDLFSNHFYCHVKYEDGKIVGAARIKNDLSEGRVNHRMIVAGGWSKYIIIAGESRNSYRSIDAGYRLVYGKSEAEKKAAKELFHSKPELEIFNE